MANRPTIRNPQGRGKPLSNAPLDDSMYHGGVVRATGPYGKESQDDIVRAERAFLDSITRGIEALENGTSNFAPDVETVPGAAVETFDVFDVHTGEHLMIWRVACRERAKHEN